MTPWRMTKLMAVMVLAVLGVACEREDRRFRSERVLDESREDIALSTNSPGPGVPIEHRSGIRGDYEKAPR